MDNIKTPPRR